MQIKTNLNIISILLTGCLIIINSCFTGKQQSYHTSNAPVLDSMQLVMGRLPELNNLPDFNTKMLDSIKEKTYTRYRIHFTVAQGEVLPALLYLPHNSGTAKSPAMLVLHSTDATGKMVLSGESRKPDRAYAVELAERGYVVIAPDYPGSGELADYDFANDRYESGTMKGIFNHIRCVDYLQSLPLVDKDRVGVIGHSLGGHNAIFISAFDKRLKITVSSCGWTKFNYYDAGEAPTKLYGGKMGPWAQERYMPWVRTKYHLDPNRMPFDFDIVIGSIAPRAVFINAPLHDKNFNVEGVKEGMKKIEQPYKKLHQENKLKVAYPDTGHDFPDETRLEAYRFIDEILQHHPNNHQLHK